MGSQHTPGERRKRKKSIANNISMDRKKRARASSSTAGAVDESLLRVLTGTDENDAPAAEVTVPETQDPCEGISKSGEEQGKGNNEDVGQNQASEPSSVTDWPKVLSEAHAKKLNVTVLLENANLETLKQSGRSGGVVLLNCDDHKHVLKKTGRDANDARPDITHQCLLMLMDSPLNKAGRLKVYIRTSKSVLIEIHPQTRIPRTIKRFSGLMAELLEKFKVRGTSGSTPLLKVIRNPITSHLPVGTRKVVCTYNSDNIVDIREHASKIASLVLPSAKGTEKHNVTEEQLEEDGEVVNVLYVVGAMAHGKIIEDWADEYICMSEYPLSAATVCSRITYTYEALFGIL